MTLKTPLIIALILVAILAGLIVYQLIYNQLAGPRRIELGVVLPEPSIEPLKPVPGKNVTKRHGPFQIGSPVTQKIFVDILCFQADDRTGAYQGEEDFGMSVIAEDGSVLYSEDHPDGLILIEVTPVPLPNNQGAILLVTPHHFNATEGGGVTQFLCFRQDGSFGPITDLIDQPDIEFAASTETISYKEKDRSLLCCVGYSDTGNFKVIRYLPLYFNGAYKTSPKFIELEEYPVSIDEVKAAKLRQDGSIHLYKAALLKAEVKTLQFRRDAKVKFLGAKYITKEDSTKLDFNTQWWLHVVIDGAEGYMINRKELVTLGLEFHQRDDADFLE